jgi:pseudaminic acid biosynthesis-associated methylase
MSSKGEKTSVAQSDEIETAQAAVWRSEFGREYSDRNTFSIEQLNQLYEENYGISREQINEKFLSGMPKCASFLEVGCNTGNELLLLQRMGYFNLSGIELQPYALNIARRRIVGVSLTLGSALAIPHENSSFDVVFTSGVLIHISPQDLPRALGEIYRCSKRYIWGFEYYAPELTEIAYRGHSKLLWKMDYAQEYLTQFSDLALVREQRLPYLRNSNVDSMFLLEKRNELPRSGRL